MKPLKKEKVCLKKKLFITCNKTYDGDVPSA